MEEPSKDAKEWAKKAGTFEVEGFRPVNRLQVVTVEQALALRERAVELPALAAATKAAPKEERPDRQGKLL